MYLRGLISSLARRQIGIPYDRSERQHDQSKYGLRALLRMAIDGIVAHSSLPLQLSFYVGLVVAFGSAVLALFYLVLHLVWPNIGAGRLHDHTASHPFRDRDKQYVSWRSRHLCGPHLDRCGLPDDNHLRSCQFRRTDRAGRAKPHAVKREARARRSKDRSIMRRIDPNLWSGRRALVTGHMGSKLKGG